MIYAIILSVCSIIFLVFCIYLWGAVISSAFSNKRAKRDHEHQTNVLRWLTPTAILSIVVFIITAILRECL